ncbi:MAG: Na+/H+ antiporter NhaA [Bacteroidota bacterium]
MNFKKKPVEIIAYIDATNKTAYNARSNLDRAIERLGDSAKLDFRFFRSSTSDLLQFENGTKAVIAAEKQGRFMDFQNALFEMKGEFSKENLIRVASVLGLETNKFIADFDSLETTALINQSQEDAKKAGLKISPGLTIDGKVYEGPWDEYALMESVEKRGAKHIEIAMDSFFSWGASAAFILLFMTIASLIYSNVGYHDVYEYIRQLDFGFSLGEKHFKEPLEIWVNDALMAIFFFMIGLEIKREIISGELSEINKAMMPIIGAIGGMLLPAIFYVTINFNSPGAYGWGIPMATDIAFTLGLMALLGNKASTSLKIFISALAVADDLGAILVIAIFYGHGFHLDQFLLAIFVTIIMGFLNYKKVYSISIYIFLGLFLWYFIFLSGIHATLAGVITAAFIPSRREGDIIGVATQTQIIFDQEVANIQDENTLDTTIRSESLKALNKALERLKEPAYYLEHSLEKWVSYLILPIFAFFNTGILILGAEIDLLTKVNIGIFLGLCFGKPIGIFLFCWISSKLNIAFLSPAISWYQLFGAGCLAGVGFTMSIVVASTAFNGSMLESAKLSILIASFLSAITGLLILRNSKK